MFGNQNIFQGPRKNLFDPEVSLRPQCNLFILQSFEILFSIRMSKSGSGILADRADETFPRIEVVGLIGLEPMTPALSRRCSNQLSYRPDGFAGGGMGIRTPDIQLAKLALYQLSYTPLAPPPFGRKRAGGSFFFSFPVSKRQKDRIVRRVVFHTHGRLLL